MVINTSPICTFLVSSPHLNIIFFHFSLNFYRVNLKTIMYNQHERKKEEKLGKIKVPFIWIHSPLYLCHGMRFANIFGFFFAYENIKFTTKKKRSRKSIFTLFPIDHGILVCTNNGKQPDWCRWLFISIVILISLLLLFFLFFFFLFFSSICSSPYFPVNLLSLWQHGRLQIDATLNMVNYVYRIWEIAMEKEISIRHWKSSLIGEKKNTLNNLNTIKIIIRKRRSTCHNNASEWSETTLKKTKTKFCMCL